MINLDMVGYGSSYFQAYTSSNADMNSILRSMTASLEPVFPEISTQEPYPSDHRAFYSKGIPSVMFSTGKYPEHDTYRDVSSILDFEGMEAELEYVYNFTRKLANLDSAPIFNPENIKSEVPDSKIYGYYDTDQRASFLGHADPKYFILKWVYQYLRYPEEAREEGIQGRVMVRFTIDVDGSVKDATVTRSVDPLLDAEALRVINASPKWKPAKVNGKPVKVSLSIPVEFILEKKKR
jgi:TonB family protein